MKTTPVWMTLLFVMARCAFCGEAEDSLNGGVERFSKGDFDGAIADYGKAIELKPGDAAGYYNRGIAKNAKNDSDGAIADYGKAIELNPKFAEAYFNRGNVKRARDDLDGAVLDFTKAIELKPGFAEAYNNRGAVKMLKQGWDEALADFTKAIESKPDLKGILREKTTISVSSNLDRVKGAKKLGGGELAAVIDWLIKEGNAEKVELFLSKGLGLGDGKFSLHSKSYGSVSAKMSYIAGVSITGEEIFISQQKDDRTGPVWLTSRAGELRSTVFQSNGTSAERVPNEKYARGFVNMKRFFLNLAVLASPDEIPVRAKD